MRVIDEPMSIDRFSGSYRFLSNFYPSPVKFDGLLYRTVEHAFQAAKTQDPTERRKICEAETPGEAKRLGRKATLRKDWESVKLGVMEELLTQKFAKGSLRQQLLDTGSAKLIEGNTWRDVFWGVYEGMGKNHLGLLLMKVRSARLPPEAGEVHLVQRADAELLDALLDDERLADDERKAFDDMREQIRSAVRKKLSDRQRMWAEKVARRLDLAAPAENLVSRGLVPRGREVETPEVLKNLPKTPPRRK